MKARLRLVCRLAQPRAAAIIGSGTPAATAAMPEALWAGLGPSMPASAMIRESFLRAVARDQGQWGLPAAFSALSGVRGRTQGR